MVKKKADSSTETPKKTDNSDQDRQIVLLGLLALASHAPSGAGSDVSVADLRNTLRVRGMDVPALEAELDSLITTFSWLGLAWTNPEKTALSTLGGVRWFTRSAMYKKLVSSMPVYQRLTQLFADSVAALPDRVSDARLLVDAGSTTYHCLFHPDCYTFRRQINRLLTNNLFVALRWQEEFGDRGPVTLIGGVPDIQTAATVDHEKLDQWLGASSRQPHITLLSWHYVVPTKIGDSEDVLLFTKNNREIQVKRSAMDAAKSVIYVVFSKDKIRTSAPSGALEYSAVRDLLRIQEEYPYKDEKNRDEKGRDVYVITDLEKPYTPEQQRMIDTLREDRFKKMRINLVLPENGD